MSLSPEQIEALENSIKRQMTAYHKYRKSAEQAKKEGFPNIALLFLATAEAEKIHAKNYYRLLHKKELTDEEIENFGKTLDLHVGNTIENLEEAIKAEHYENTELYPKYAELFRGVPGGYILFFQTAKVEGTHRDNFKKALEKAKQGKDIDPTQFFVCPICGYVATGEKPFRCPICAEPGKSFIQIA